MDLSKFSYHRLLDGQTFHVTSNLIFDSGAKSVACINSLGTQYCCYIYDPDRTPLNDHLEGLGQFVLYQQPHPQGDGACDSSSHFWADHNRHID